MDYRKKGVVSLICIFPKGIDGLSQNRKAEIGHPGSLTTEIWHTKASKMFFNERKLQKQRNFRVWH